MRFFYDEQEGARLGLVIPVPKGNRTQYRASIITQGADGLCRACNQIFPTQADADAYMRGEGFMAPETVRGFLSHAEESLNKSMERLRELLDSPRGENWLETLIWEANAVSNDAGTYARMLAIWNRINPEGADCGK